MFVKVIVIAVTALFATASEATLWNGFVATWSLNTSTHFYELPKTSTAAKIEGWTPISGVGQPRGVEALGYRDDPTLVLLFYKKVVFGFQLAFLVSEVNPNQPVEWTELDIIIPKQLNGKSFYTATAYFLEDERTDTRRIWLEEKNRMREIPTKTSEVLSETPWLLKNCVPTMGTHYYEWYPQTKCATLEPWVLLAMGDNVTGLIFQGPGTPSTIGSRDWWDKIPNGGLFRAISDPPQCVADAITGFGAMSMHIWFVDKPQTIRCN